LTARAINGEGTTVTSAPIDLMVLASLRSAEIRPDGSFQCQLAGEPGRTYVIEVSEDLQTWTPWATNTVDATGWMDIADKVLDGMGTRYYRARFEP
jgi:hypothetical protein